MRTKRFFIAILALAGLAAVGMLGSSVFAPAEGAAAASAAIKAKQDHLHAKAHAAKRGR